MNTNETPNAVGITSSADLAKLAGPAWSTVLDIDWLDRLVKLVREDERQRLLAGAGEPVAWRAVNANPPGGYVVFQQFPQAYSDSGRPYEGLYTADQVAAAVLRERISIAEHFEAQPHVDHCGTEIGAAIRARGQS